ncbi:uncharacterized protein LOC122644165 [Telopea speciosissima]|uniref:uncharacterized protein LOC122644165 n=1 Tax=Telopea speciosissima TaxID=54955 RepID=UPI001CC5B739|nr:uncharacterized protein LOC122644165 [Telopea speciosissima]
MDLNSDILEISSDEDGAWDERSFDNLDWISDLLDTGGCETEDSDDVVFVSERQSSKPANRPKLTSGDDSDDDCTILDGDPENPVAAVNDSADGSDELLIVGEKGQLACRDYPHPRHLCAKFSFSSTPHDKYCDVCHCYVCDSRAPCIYWGTGLSTTDHCHSNDKEEIWRIERKKKQGTLPPTPAQKLPVTTLSMIPPLPNQALAFNPMQLPNSGCVTHSVSSPPLRACPSMTSFGVPRSNQRPGVILSRSRCPQNLSRSPSMLSTNDLIRRERNHIGGTLGPQFSTQLFKKVAFVPTVFPMNRHGYGSSNCRNGYTSQPLTNQHPVVMENDEINMRWQNIQAGSEPNFDSCQSSSQPDTGSSFSEFHLYAQPQVYSQPIPQSGENQNLYRHENPTPASANPSALDFNSGWIDSSTQAAQHSPAEGSQIQGVQLTSDLQPVQSLFQNESPPVSAANPLYTGSPNPDSSRLHLENWICSLEHESTSEIAKEIVLSELDFVPPQHDSLETALPYYDIESSWNALAPV